MSEQNTTKDRAPKTGTNNESAVKTDPKKLKILEEEEKSKKKLRKKVAQESKRITKVIVPICFCMLIVVVSINFFPIYSNGIKR